MNRIPETPIKFKDHHRPFLGPDGMLRIAASGNSWRYGSAVEAALLAPRVRHRVTGFRDEG